MLIRANDAPYNIGLVAEEKVFGVGLSGRPRVRVFDSDGATRGVAVSCGKYLRIIAVDRDYRGRGIGTALLRDSRARIIAAEPGNYFLPGVLDPAFFVKRGYREMGHVWNLHVEIRDSRFEIRNRRRESRISNLESRTPLADFISRHFGRAWAFEAQRASIVHYIENIGFAVADANNKGLGTFGPVGVLEQHRGKGYGRRLLLACLADLRRLRFERAIIPWTTEIDFYRKSCGAEPAHRFVALRKSL